VRFVVRCAQRQREMRVVIYVGAVGESGEGGGRRSEGGAA